MLQRHNIFHRGMKIWYHVPAHEKKATTMVCRRAAAHSRPNRKTITRIGLDWWRCLEQQCGWFQRLWKCVVPHWIAFAPGPNISETMSICYVLCQAQRPSDWHNTWHSLTFARMAEHLLNALPCAAAISISIDALLVVTLMIDLRADHLRRYWNS